ncbi:hypothetical protein HaLaN_10258, partial [Haematococcus lacustris]
CPTGVVPCEQGLCHPFKQKRGNVQNDRLVHKATKRKECTVEPPQGKLPKGRCFMPCHLAPTTMRAGDRPTCIDLALSWHHCCCHCDCSCNCSCHTLCQGMQNEHHANIIHTHIASGLGHA